MPDVPVRRRSVIVALAMVRLVGLAGVVQALLTRRRLVLRSGWVMKAHDR